MGGTPVGPALSILNLRVNHGQTSTYRLQVAAVRPARRLPALMSRRPADLRLRKTRPLRLGR